MIDEKSWSTELMELNVRLIIDNVKCEMRNEH